MGITTGTWHGSLIFNIPLTLSQPYGRIRDVKLPTPVPAGVHRSALVTFERTHAAAIAHNCIHGAFIPSLTDATKFTRLNTGYERPIKPHLIRDWLASHPKIVFPVVVFLLGTLTYTVSLSTGFCFRSI